MRFRWTKETYSRRTVEDVENFVGWPFLEKILASCKHPRDRGLIAALFETGGRVSEVLELTIENFLRQYPFLVVKSMPVFKRYEKMEDYQDVEGKTRWLTEPKKAYRTFPIHLKEPLVQPLLALIERKKQGRLFKIGRKRVYQIVTALHPTIYPHWFRAQRASQLALEYGYDVHDLVDFFNWKDMVTAVHYSRMGWKGLAAKMQR